MPVIIVNAYHKVSAIYTTVYIVGALCNSTISTNVIVTFDAISHCGYCDMVDYIHVYVV